MGSESGIETLSPPERGRLTAWLAAAPAGVLTAYAIATSFTTYFCMYAFRKPFAAAEFDGLYLFGTAIELKTSLAISQTIGYGLSKYVGIKVCAEATRARRPRLLVGLILVSYFGLLLFAVVPRDWKLLAIFFAAGLPLGMIWGLVVWYLEGRRMSEVLLAGLCCSFILASGYTKDVGRRLLSLGVSDEWMPFAAASLFLPVYLVAVWLLDQVPQPTRDDEHARTVRETMNATHRLAFLKHFLFGMLVLLVAYCFLTAHRDFRDYFQVEIFSELGYDYQQHKSIITQSETLVALGVLAALASLALIRDNRWGLIGAFGVMGLGTVVMGLGTLLLDRGAISGFWWMVLNGLGGYLFYVPFNSVLFDRLIASTHVVGTAVFAIYIFDAIGYTGSIALMLTKDALFADVSKLDFFRGMTYGVSLLGAMSLAISLAYFLARHVRR
jgi:hypothetical protein